MFKLVTDEKQLVLSKDPMARKEFIQVSPLRNSTGANFGNGPLEFRLDLSGRKWWVPRYSSIRIRCALTRPDTKYLEERDGVAPANGMASCLFQEAEVRLNNTVISQVRQFLPQVNSIRKRTEHSKGWLDSVGAVGNWWESDVKKRVADVSRDGGDAKALVSTPLSAILDVAGGNTMAVTQPADFKSDSRSRLGAARLSRISRH